MARDFGFSSRKIDVSQFSMVPRPDVPRSAFSSQHTHKTTFDAGFLVPIYLDEVLPGDSIRVNLTAFCRMATPLFPMMDNLHLDTFFFFVPNRLVWDNWARMMGERDDPDDHIDFLTPIIRAENGYAPCSLADYFGIPTDTQTTDFWHISLPFRAYNLIWNEWFRDQNLQDRVPVPKGDGPDDEADFQLLRRGKRHDYFTSALPWPQKGDSVTLPLGTTAPLNIVDTPTFFTGIPSSANPLTVASGNVSQASSDGTLEWVDPGLEVDLSQATAATINSIRQAFQIQKLLERDARGGTRYTELLQAHFGVSSPDMRLQRPEYLGGGSTAINVTPVAQTSATGIDGGSSPLGALGAVGTSVASPGFSQSFVEHGMIIGLACVRADLTYQQGLHRMWRRRTRYDYYWPAFAHLGEQAVYRHEIYLHGDWLLGEPAGNNGVVFGYQERWADYRHKPSRISGMFRSGISGTLDSWHLAQYYAGTPPVLSDEFIQDEPPMPRVLAAGELAENVQFLCDALFNVRHVRAMPVQSVPGFVDRF